ncbi:hypothetical protein B0H14DRAFT_3628173 [Mycena olivaceomarginata]|nr:hypothetical protein B0H14DRAFT_3628173 [Mycena olivaceomarginata]
MDTSTDLSPSDIQLQLNINAYTSLVAFTLLYFDFFITFEREVSRYWGTRLNLSIFLFYFNRYATFFGTIPIMFEYFWTTGSVTKSKYVAAVVVFCEPTLKSRLVMRTYALYGSSRRVLAFMLCFAIVVFGFGAWSFVDRDGSPTGLRMDGNFSLRCHEWGPKHPSLTSFQLSASTVLVLTIWKGCETYRLSSCSGKRRQGLVPTLVRDGVVYFLVVAVANCANIISYMVAGPYLRGVGSTLTTVFVLDLVRFMDLIYIYIGQAYHRHGMPFDVQPATPS